MGQPIRFCNTILIAGALCLAPASFSADRAKQRVIFQEFIAEGDRLNASLERELRASQVEQAYSVLKGPQTLSRAALDEAVLRVNKAEKALTTFQPQFELMAKSTCDKLTAVNAQDGRDCKAGLVASPLTRRFELQRLYYSDLRSVLQFLASKYGTFTIEPRGYLFKGKGDGDSYNRLVNTLIARGTEVQTLQQQGQLSVKSLQSKMNSQR